MVKQEDKSLDISDPLFEQIASGNFMAPLETAQDFKQYADSSFVFPEMGSYGQTSSAGNYDGLSRVSDSGSRGSAGSIVSTTDSISNDNNNNKKFPSSIIPYGAQNSLAKIGLTGNQISLLVDIVSAHIGYTPQPPDPPDYSFSSVATSSATNEENMPETETDKKKRSTAASARFRVKKKIREQKLSESVRSLRELSDQLETRVKSLGMENQVLKNLIVEQNSTKTRQEVDEMKQRALRNFGGSVRSG